MEFARHALFETNWVHGESMSPTLSPDYVESGKKDMIFVAKLGAKRQIKRGDVVVFWKPQDPEKSAIKRVVALEGDVVWRDVRRIGGEKLLQDQGLKTPAEKQGFASMGPVVKVPVGHIWVEGDNWRRSLDSNDYGAISKNIIIGKGVGILWPLSRWGSIPSVNPTDNNFPKTKVTPSEPYIPPWLIDD